IGVILREAAHNLGPHSDYKVGGKGPAEAFGGRMAATLEELKAQTASWFLADLLRRNGVIDEAQLRQLYVHALVWSFGHLSQGLVSATGAPKPYSQLSAVHVGRLVEAGALTWAVSLDPATGRPVGHFDMDFAKVHPAMEALMRDVGRVKATGDAAAAGALVQPYVSGDKRGLVRLEEIVERLRPFPRATMRYEVTL
ncbi:MAG: hypothetical protein FJ087_11660, partial [Deltaproteobacteria bacterium]|nr:hypothetical protein [Deltaproteobacteria bacterium]